MKISSNGLSASAIKVFLMCPFKYYLTYILKIRRPDTFATLNGRIIHSALEKYSLGHTKNWREELLWRYKKHKPWELHKKFLSHKNNCETCRFLKEEFSTFHGNYKELLTSNKACPMWHYAEAINLVESVLARKVNPFEYKLIDVEKKFNLDIGEGVHITGFIDLVSEISDGVLEIRDWKTGKWLPTYEEALKDPQLRLYDLAASMLYPEYKTRILTFDYLKSKEYTFVINDEERKKNKEWLISIARKIRNCKQPLRVTAKPYTNHKCKFLCMMEECMEEWPFKKTKIKNLIAKGKF